MEPGIPGIDDEEEDLPPYHTYYQFIRPPLEDIALPKDTMEEDAEMDDDYDDDEDDDSDEDSSEAASKSVPTAPEPPRPTTLQQRMLAIAGQDVNTVIQEMDYLHRQKEMNRQVTHETRKARMEAGDFDEDPSMDNKYPPHMPPHPSQFPRPPMMPSYGPYGSMVPPPPMGYGGFAPPPIPGSRLPPGPPPRMPQGLTPRLIRPPGMPPPPPPGKAFEIKIYCHIHFLINNHLGLRPGAPSMLSTRPQMSTSAPSKPSSKPTASIIEAKPQMRNLSADLTRFVPTTLKVKKDMPPKKDMAKSSANPHIEWRTPQVQVNKTICNQLVVVEYLTFFVLYFKIYIFC